MADHRYGNRERERGSSIFPDDDGGRARRTFGGRDETERWRSENAGLAGGESDRGHGGRTNMPSRGSPDDRGFFDRANDEVRSWFGDEEAERRREADARRYEREHGTSGAYRGGGHDDQWTGGSPEQRSGQYERGEMRSNQGRTAGSYSDERYEGGYGASSSAPGGSSASAMGQSGQGRGQPGTAHHDEAYRRWREQQIEALDREYEEYCRHRQQQFEQEFTSFRQSRQSGVTSGGPTMSHSGAPRGSTEMASSPGAAQGMGAQTGGQTGGENSAATTTGSGSASAATASVGSTGMAAETGNELGSVQGGRSGKRRS